MLQTDPKSAWCWFFAFSGRNYPGAHSRSRRKRRKQILRTLRATLRAVELVLWHWLRAITLRITGLRFGFKINPISASTQPRSAGLQKFAADYIVNSKHSLLHRSTRGFRVTRSLWTTQYCSEGGKNGERNNEAYQLIKTLLNSLLAYDNTCYGRKQKYNGAEIQWSRRSRI